MKSNHFYALLGCAVLCCGILVAPDMMRLKKAPDIRDVPLPYSWHETSKWDELHVEWTLVDTLAQRQRSTEPKETLILARAKITNPTVYAVSLYSLTLNLAVDDLPIGEPTEFVPFSLVNDVGQFIDPKTTVEGTKEVWIPSSTVPLARHQAVITRSRYKVHKQ